MEWLNYHHLLYFWHVAREGGLAPAGKVLLLSPSTVSAQVHALERALGHRLFEKRGRSLELTESGRVVYRYAEEIFSLGRELQDALGDRPAGRPMRLSVGVADVVPKPIAQRVLQAAQAGGAAAHLLCREDTPERLLAALALHDLDVILTDAPAPAHAPVQAHSHLLGEYGVTIFAGRALAARLAPGFPASLDGAPLLLPTPNTMLRRSLDLWMHEAGVHPEVVGEFEDSALLMAFGQKGMGAFPAPTPIAREVQRQHRVAAIGSVPGVSERLYAVNVERRLKHPGVLAIRDAARAALAPAAPAPARRRPARASRK